MPTAEDYSYILGMNRTPDPPGTREPTALDAAAILAGWGLREVEGGVEKAFGVGANIMDLASRPDYAVWNVLHAAQEGRINLDSFISDIGREVGKGLSPKSAEDRGSFTNIVQTAVQQRARALATGKRKIDFTDLVLFGLPEKALNLGIEGLGLAGDVVLSPTDKVAKVVKLGDKYNNVIDWASGKIRQAGETPWEAVSTRAKFLDPDIPDNTPKEQKAAIFASDAAKIGGTQAADAFARQMAKVGDRFSGKSADEIVTILRRNANGITAKWQDPAIELKKWTSDFSKRTGVPESAITEAVENSLFGFSEVQNSTASRLAANGWGMDMGVASNPFEQTIASHPEFQAMVKEVNARNAERLAAEQRAGVPVKGLNDVLNYMAHIETKEGKKTLEKLNITPRSYAEWSATHQYDLRDLKGKTISQLNDMAAKGDLFLMGKRVVMPKGVKLFEDDPAVIMALRGFAGERAMANADYLDNMVVLFGKSQPIDENWAKIADDIMGDFPEYANILSGVYFHPEIANEITRTLRISTPEGLKTYQGALKEVMDNALRLQGMDMPDTGKYLQAWKSGTLALRPSYHTANIVGNIWNNFLAGVVDPGTYELAARAMKGSKELVNIGGKQANLSDLWEAFEKQGLLDTGFYGGDIRKSITNAVKPKGLYGQAIDKAFEGQSLYENWTRFAHFLEKSKGGMNFDDAAESVRKYLFDYSDLSPADIAMKQIQPFWTFTRKNIPLQVEMLFAEPGKFTAPVKAKNIIEQGHETTPQELTPEWLQGEGAVEYAPGKFTNVDKFVPSMDVGSWFRDPLTRFVSGTRPEIRVPFELAMQKLVYSKQDTNPMKLETILGVPMREPLAEALRSSVPGMAAYNEWSNVFTSKRTPAEKASSLLGGKTYNVDKNTEMYFTIDGKGGLTEQISWLNKQINDSKVSVAKKVLYRQQRDELVQKKLKLEAPKMQNYGWDVGNRPKYTQQ